VIASARVEIDEHNYEVTIEVDRSISPALALRVANDALTKLLPEEA
jgi:hypothetical protein